jgi:hypothetical protein
VLKAAPLWCGLDAVPNLDSRIHQQMGFLKEFEWASGQELKVFAQKKLLKSYLSKAYRQRSFSRFWKGGP